MIATLEPRSSPSLGATRRDAGPPWWGWALLVTALVGGAWWAQRSGRRHVQRWRLGRLQRRAAKHRTIASVALQEAKVLADELGLSDKQFTRLVRDAGTPQKAAAEIEATLAEIEQTESTKRKALRAAIEGANRITGEPRVPGGKQGGRRRGSWTREYEKLRVRAEEKHGVELPRATDPEFAPLARELGV